MYPSLLAATSAFAAAWWVAWLWRLERRTRAALRRRHAAQADEKPYELAA